MINVPKRILFAALRSLKTPAARYPADPRAVFILMMCVVSGIPLLLGRATPGSINDQLDKPQVITWGVLLVLGASTTLVGMFRQSVNGVILEQVGSVAVGGACWIYAGAIWAQVGEGGTVPGGIIFGLGSACFWRWGQLQTYLRDAERLAQHRRDRRVGDK